MLAATAGGPLWDTVRALPCIRQFGYHTALSSLHATPLVHRYGGL